MSTYVPPQHLLDQVGNGREAFRRTIERMRSRSPGFAALQVLFVRSQSPGKMLLLHISDLENHSSIAEQFSNGAEVLLSPPKKSSIAGKPTGSFLVVYDPKALELHSLVHTRGKVRPFNFKCEGPEGIKKFRAGDSLDILWLLVYPNLLINFAREMQMRFAHSDQSLQLRARGRECLLRLHYCDEHSLPFTIRMPVNPGASFVTGATSSGRHSRVQLSAVSVDDSQDKVFEASEEDKKLHPSGHPIPNVKPANDRIPDPAKLSKLQEHLYTQAGILRIPKSSREGNRYPVEPHTLGPSPLARS